ncbi:TatD family hydrolase [Caballeronia sp. LZ065]|uniref:TatD family hydrolase n=1 Tax=Caballeronia sp. LZ065 TaxID=3038571 RepID=UPI0028645495|nr:TatD family hydrolase [Caballeronia sp. LZ065]MDR5781285.1 TatD family hydrolase [Caballeronia sp. LZ065]
MTLAAMLVDISVNFHSKQLTGLATEIIERAKNANVGAVLATGTSLESSRSALVLAHQHPDYLFSTAGVHPHSADDWNDSIREELLAILADPACVAVGETGLDYHRNFSTPANQRRAFADQLGMAADIRKPLFLHCRDAFDDFYAMLKDSVAGGVHGVAHCFTGGPDEAMAFVELGLDIGVTGWVTDLSRGQALREAVKFIPMDRLHLETDAPYLGPKNAKKRRPYNEPANLAWIARAVAELRDIDEVAVMQACTSNSIRLFKLSSSS